ncbi:MAG: RHS repeat protein, partial [Candidatus Lindowbacteria bacterium]|nr:RHS repeat protein [Candidatus Lindowbacteria bacterium]
MRRFGKLLVLAAILTMALVAFQGNANAHCYPDPSCPDRDCCDVHVELVPAQSTFVLLTGQHIKDVPVQVDVTDEYHAGSGGPFPIYYEFDDPTCCEGYAYQGNPPPCEETPPCKRAYNWIKPVYSYNPSSCGNEAFWYGNAGWSTGAAYTVQHIKVIFRLHKCPGCSNTYCFECSGTYQTCMFVGEFDVAFAPDPAEKERLESNPEELQKFVDRYRGDPVDVVTGNMQTFPQVDFTLSGIDEPLEFYRTYNSQTSYDGVFGKGWTHNFNLVLTSHSNDSDIDIMDEKGMYHFFHDVDGRIVSIDEPGRRPYNQLIEYAYYSGGELEEVRKPVDEDTMFGDKYTYMFGYLLSIYEKRGDPLGMLYETSFFMFFTDEYGRCVEVFGESNWHEEEEPEYYHTEFDYSNPNQTVATRMRGAEQSQQFVDIYTHDGQNITQIEHVESGVIEKYSYDIVPGGTSTLTKLITNSGADYFLKKISHYDANFNLIDTAEGRVPNEGANPTATPVRMYYEDTANNPNYLTRVLDQRGVNTKFVYANPDGRITQTYKYKEGQGTQYEITNMGYNANGTLSYVTDPNGKTTNYSYTYDQNGVLTSMSVNPPGVLPETQHVYDAAGRLTRTIQKDDAGNDRVTDIARDWAGSITQITYPEEGGTRLSAYYDHDAWDWYEGADYAAYCINVVDTNGVKTQYVYYWHNLLWMIVKDRGDGEGDANAVTEFVYNCSGNLKKLTDAKGNVTTFTYDSLDRLTAITDAEGHSTTFTYWPDGSVKTRTDRNGALTEYSYNNDNRLSQTVYKPDGQTVAETVTFGYEANGLLNSAQNAAGTVTYQYDDINRLTTANGALSGVVDQVSYQYYDGGQTHYMTSGVGQTSYVLNDWNALQSITNPNDR